ncbi:MAG: universal stress protein [Dehalococcoidales bacterium]|nr:universal stress protein [Dehalococcoidales bacterium]
MTIIAPLDGSALAESILPHVEAIAKSRVSGSIDVILVRVCEAPPINSDYPEGMAVSWEDHVEQEVAQCQVGSKQYLSNIERRLLQSGIKVKQETLVGRVADEIVDLAARTPSSLIAMSTHGRSGVGRGYTVVSPRKFLTERPVQSYWSGQKDNSDCVQTAQLL